jgi:Tfp pilus assembly protein PilX
MKNQSGFALLIVLVLMAVGTALIFSAMNGALLEDEIARTGTARRRALVAAEAELWTAATTQSAAPMRIASPGRVSSTSQRIGELSLITTVDKVDTSNVWIVVSATIQQPGTVARHRLGISVQIPRDTGDLTLHPVPERAWAELF